MNHAKTPTSAGGFPFNDRYHTCCLQPNKNFINYSVLPDAFNALIAMPGPIVALIVTERMY